MRGALAALPERTPLPDISEATLRPRVPPGDVDPVATFAAEIERAGGRAFTEVAALGEWLAARPARAGYCDPAVLDLVGSALGAFELDSTLARARIDAYDFGITRAAGAIAETGTVILDDATTSTRLGSLAPWIHVAIVRRADIHRSLGAAISALGGDPYVVWCTGPSKTADVEGILIQGVHGPGEQIALIVDAW